MKRLILLSCMLMLSACSGDEEQDNEAQIQQLIAQNQQLWEDQGLIDYQYTMQVSLADCPEADALPPIDFQVEDDQVVAAFISGTSEEIDIEDALTISDLFLVLYAISMEDSKQFSASKNDNNPPQFDADMGYPVSFFVDYSNEACDAFQYQILSVN